jgi:hypothetical protein
MKKITFLLLFIAVNTFAQTTFKKGYFITNNDIKKEVFFKAFNDEYPKSFFYKVALNSDNIEEILADNLTEVHIYNISRFVRKDISFEELEKGMISKKENNTMAFSKIKKNVLLKMHLDSENLKLFSYRNKETDNVYFFIKDNKTIKLLEYKIIKKNSKNYILKPFRNFLYQNYRIEGKDQINAGKLRYNEKDFVKYFNLYTQSQNINAKKYETFKRSLKDVFNISVIAGLGLTSQENENSGANVSSDFNNLGVNLGISLELFQNSYRKKSSIITTLLINLNSSHAEDFSFIANNANDVTVESKLNAVNLDVKYRQYFNNKTNTNRYFYINAGIGTNYSLGNTKYFFNTTNSLIADLDYSRDLKVYFLAGIGYNFNKYSIDLNYIPAINGDFSNNEKINSGNWSFNRQVINFTLSYEIF